MKIKGTISVLLLTLFTMLSIACTKTKTEGQISFKDVLSIEIIMDKDNKVVYTLDKNKKEIEEFVDALNLGNRFGSIKKKTLDTSFKIYFKNGTAMVREQ